MPIEDISARRTSAEVKVFVMNVNVYTKISSSATQTSVSFRLLPEQLGDLLGPGIFNILRHALQHPRVIWLSLPEPNLELGGRIARVRCEANI